MEMTWEEWKAMKKQLRRRLGSTGWTLLIYYVIINVAVFLWVFAEMMIKSVQYIVSGDLAAMEQAATEASESGWGYFLAVFIGLLILLLWKKPGFFREEIFAKGKPMGFGSFFAILCVFLGVQLPSQLMTSGLELLLNRFGLSMLEGMEALSMDSDNLSMFLYAGILAPISEEILFRGLIQRSLRPFGRNFAIFCSALTFGLFHGNLIQTPFAFAVGLVLGYVACEHSIFWAMLLHMINNLMFADMLGRLTSGLPEEISNLIFWVVMAFFTVAAVVILIRKRDAIREWRLREPINRTYLGCFFSSFGVIAFILVMGIMMVVSQVLMTAPV